MELMASEESVVREYKERTDLVVSDGNVCMLSVDAEWFDTVVV
jgi:hypothetical protein